MINKTDDIRIINTQELISPKDIISQLSPSESGIETIIDTRSEIKNILDKKSKKFVKNFKMIPDPLIKRLKTY